MQPMVLASAEAIRHAGRLEVLMYVQVGVAIFKMILFGIFAGFGDLMSCLVLYCAYK